MQLLIAAYKFLSTVQQLQTGVNSGQGDAQPTWSPQ